MDLNILTLRLSSYCEMAAVWAAVWDAVWDVVWDAVWDAVWAAVAVAAPTAFAHQVPQRQKSLVVPRHSMVLSLLRANKSSMREGGKTYKHTVDTLYILYMHAYTTLTHACTT